MLGSILCHILYFLCCGVLTSLVDGFLFLGNTNSQLNYPGVYSPSQTTYQDYRRFIAPANPLHNKNQNTVERAHAMQMHGSSSNRFWHVENGWGVPNIPVYGLHRSRRPFSAAKRFNLSPRENRSQIRSVQSPTKDQELMYGEEAGKTMNVTGKFGRRWWLDTIAKLLHSHPLSTDGRRRVYAASVIDLNPNQPSYHGENGPFHWSQQAQLGQESVHGSMHGLTGQQNSPTVVGWRRKSRMPIPYDHSSWMADQLRERIELYRKWMSPKQWKQFLSETLPGSVSQRFNLALFEAAAIGVRRAVAECRYQFRHERWNCSQSSDHDAVLFGNILLKGIPQTAFVYSIINAGIVQAVAEACLGQIDNCPCNNRGREVSNADWQWQGCDHNIHFGSKFSRRLLDTMERGSHIRYRMNLHNNRVGRMLVTRNMERYCRCHGTSGTCTLRTCYRRTPRMRTVGTLLKQIYERNLVRLEPSAFLATDLRTPSVSQKLENQFSPQRTNPSYRYARHRVPRTSIQYPFPTSTNDRQWIKRNHQRSSSPWTSKIDPYFPSSQRNRTSPNSMQLVYYEVAPNKLFCEADPQLHITGTHGRVCNSSSEGTDNCHHLCCGRGHLTHHFYVMESCHCKFIWCCRVECQQCLVLKRVETCI